jgi:hypothetical protein
MLSGEFYQVGYLRNAIGKLLRDRRENRRAESAILNSPPAPGRLPAITWLP